MIETFFNILSQPWAYRALIASCMVGAMCGALGCFIVLRNMALIGDALSHAILPGVVFAFIIVGYSVIGFFVGSVIAGLISAIAITWIQQNSATKNDALAWWKDIGSKKDSEMTEKEKLFKSDYQAYQAYSYLRAWKALKNRD